MSRESVNSHCIIRCDIDKDPKNPTEYHVANDPWIEARTKLYELFVMAIQPESHV